MIKHINKQYGVTLLELLATIAISGIFITIIFSVITTTFNQNDKTLSHVNLRQEANLIITDIRNKHQGPLKYDICKDSLLQKKTLEFDNFELFGKKIDCLKSIDPKENMHVIFTLTESQNKFEIDTIIEGTGLIVASPPIIINPVKTFYEYLVEENIFVYGASLNLNGREIIGDNGKVIIQGNLDSSNLDGGSKINTSNIEVNGSILFTPKSPLDFGSRTNPGKIIVNGDFIINDGNHNIFGKTHINGNFKFSGTKLFGDVFVKGDVDLLGTNIDYYNNATIYYTGKFLRNSKPSTSIPNNYIKVPSVPIAEITKPIEPEFKPDDWYKSNGYINSKVLYNNIKIYTDNYVMDAWNDSASNIVIVSKGNIEINHMNGRNASGVLFAPNGKVTFNGGNFTGIIISKLGVNIVDGGTTIKLQSIKDIFPNSKDVPFK